ncbi:LacI family DNA-binding transcriptional regulator [Microbacterium karelineae]|uniref:LacI family DNA-binding transcriptional regulator n=1 Tax=Microbacterium karelineae TaxID=2654283 RepID=UPI0012E9EFB4|nr:LacI family DNA-binding transcriptional regulator [Microbacterium karelineae]
MTTSDTSAPTVFDVAREAGVSISTVSKALNRSGQLRDETRERIAAVAHRLGYEPRHGKRSANGSHAYTVGLLTTGRFSRLADEIVPALEDTFKARLAAIHLAEGQGDPAREQHHVERFVTRGVDAIVVAGQNTAPRPPLVGTGDVPVCYVLSPSQRPQDVSIVIDDEQGARLATTHLLARGCRRIAYIGGPHEHPSARLRHAGMRKTLRTAGIEPATPSALWHEWSEDGGREAANILVGSGADVDGIVCANDQLARGAVEQLQHLGTRVPEDVAVVGFGNWDVIASAARPQLTSVDPRLDRLGHAVAETTLALIHGDERHGSIPLGCELVERASTRSA